MSDHCQHCIMMGNMEECQKTKCSYHELWMVKELKKKLDETVKRNIEEEGLNDLQRNEEDR